MDIVTLWLGWIVVWAFGAALLAAMFRDVSARDEASPPALILGAGFLVGQFLLTMWMRALSKLGVPFGIVSIGAPLLGVAAIAGVYAWRNRLHVNLEAARTLAARDLTKAERLLWFAILGWLALRFALLLLEVLQRPLYPWDAWTQWATKARVWFALKFMVPFVDAAQWLTSTDARTYFDAAPNYPATVPLTQTWSATLLGRWDDTLVNLPWWLTGVAFGLAFYAYLRRFALSPLAALIGTWLVLSLPILDTHIALAGYADLAMATYFTITALAALSFARTRSWRDLVLAIVLACACTTIKNPGKIWIATLVPALIAAMLPRYGLRVVGVLFAAIAIVALVLTRTGITLLGYHVELQFAMPWGGLYDAYFAYANWHLLFYALVIVVAIGWRHLLAPGIAPFTVLVVAGLAFLMFGFGFTNARLWVEDQSTVNRATLHLAPLIVVWVLLVYRAWSDAWAKRSAARQTDVGGPAEGVVAAAAPGADGVATASRAAP